MVSQPQPQRLRELGDFLRKRRARLTPEDVGFPRGSRRRATGLRREEVAQLVGVSLEWYTWLEQGRPIRTSTHVLESLARALCLGVDERKYLFFLALQQPPPEVAMECETVSPSLQRFLDNLGNCPAYVIGKSWDIVAWNDAACVTFIDYSLLKDIRERNILWHFFTWPSVQQILLNWDIIARQLIADFRTSYGRYLGDPQLTKLVQDLLIHSPEFQAMWSDHEVLGRSAGLLRLNHPLVGSLVFEYSDFQVIDAPDLKMIVYTPMNEADTSAKLSRLLQEKTSEFSQHYRTTIAMQKSARFWFIDSNHQLYQSGGKGVQTSGITNALTQLLLTNQDPIGLWLNACCRAKSDAWTDNTRIMASYTKWCQDYGYATRKAKGLTQSIAAYGFETGVLGWRTDSTGKRIRSRGVQGLFLLPD